MVQGLSLIRVLQVGCLYRYGPPARTGLGHAPLAAAIGLALSCGSSPAGPAPTPQPQNQPPSVTAIEIEPARIELNEEVVVRAIVQDAETPPGSLLYEWSSDGGTFTGEGASVTWRPPADAATPADFALRLTVRERYGPPNAQQEHRVTASSAPVRVHDSPTELREMSLKFLELFADSDKSPEECLVDFSDSCRGKESEREDIEDNRTYFDIRSASFEFDDLRILDDRLSARMAVECEFRSRQRACPSEDPGCVVGSTQEVKGFCLLTAVYENGRWWLCDSAFDPEEAPMPAPLRFFGKR